MKLIKNFLRRTVGGDFYANYTWQHLKAESDADRELNSKKLSNDDRVLDILFMLDLTGSMGTWIELSRRTMERWVNDIRKENDELDIRIAFVGYRDFGDTNTIFAIHDFTLDIPAIVAYMRTQGATGGADHAEDVQGGLARGLELNWRDNSIKMCLFCADAEAHGRQYNRNNNSDYYPEGNPSGYVLETLMQEYSDRDIAFTVYIVNEDPIRMYGIMEQAYKQGNATSEFTRIDLRDDMAAAQRQDNQSRTLEGGIVETAFYNKTSQVVVERTKEGKAKNKWM